MYNQIEEYIPYPIQLEWKISEEELRNLFDGWEPEKLISKKKNLKEIHGIQYALRAFKGKVEDNNVLEMCLLIYGQDSQTLDIYGRFNFCIKSADFVTGYDSATEALDEDDAFIYDDDDQGYCDWAHVICSEDDLFDPDKKFIVDEYTIIEVKGMLYAERKKVTEDYEEPPKPTLGDYLWKKDYKDFVIAVGKKEDKEKTEIKVHKCVLASRSTVFGKMLQTNMKEKAEEKVEIIDFDTDTVKAAVKYCYDQRLDLENGPTLLQFSNEYDIQDLKDEIVLRYIKNDLTPENICKVANASIISNAPKLRDFCCRTLLILMKQEIPVDDIDELDKEFSDDLFKKAFSGKYS